MLWGDLTPREHLSPRSRAPAPIYYGPRAGLLRAISCTQQTARHSAARLGEERRVASDPGSAGRGPGLYKKRSTGNGGIGPWRFTDAILILPMTILLIVLTLRVGRALGHLAHAVELVYGARYSRHVVDGACGVGRHPVCPSQGQRRGHGVYWSLPSLCLSQPRAEERARVAWRGVGGLAWFLSVSPRTRKTQRRVT